jgi:hypothetical protein
MGVLESPWRQVTVGDYDGHMCSAEVGQAPTLDRIFGEVLERYRPRSLAVRALAAQSGLAEVDAQQIQAPHGTAFHVGHFSRSTISEEEC